MEQHINKLLRLIAQQKCVLLIGPDLQQVNGLPLTHYLRGVLYGEFNDKAVEKKVQDYVRKLRGIEFGEFKEKIDHFYESDGFYVFKPGEKDEAIIDIRERMEALCSQLAEDKTVFDKEIYEMLAQLPFHLVLSISPDVFLSEICYEYHVRHRFGFYKSRAGSSTADVAIPTRDEPLFYNICGSVKDGALMLDYEDLFNLIQSLLSKPGLPSAIQDVLNDQSTTFLFLGFPFERWYTQLMLRMLCGTRRLRKYAARHRHPDKEVKNFLLHQFMIEFLDDEEDGKSQKDFVRMLYNAAKEFDDPILDGRPLLRTFLEPASPAEVKVIRYIQDAKIIPALVELEKAAKNEQDANDIIALRAQWTQLENEKHRLDSRDYVTRSNQIIDAILSFSRQLSKTA